MKDLYSKPLRVYLIMGALALWGIVSGFQLPVSLFPMSSQPTLSVNVSYGSYSSKQFFDSYGSQLEGQLQSLKMVSGKVEKVTAQYSDANVNYKIKFNWGADANEAQKNVENAANSILSTSELAIRRSLRVQYWRENQGFLAISFYSPLRSLDEIYEILKPLVTPMSSRISEAEGVNLFNPSGKEIKITLSPEKMAQHQLTSAEVENAVREAVVSLNGGSLKVGEKDMQLTLVKSASSVDFLNQVRVSAVNQTPVLLKDIAELSVVVSKESQRIFKTSGVDSLILFANPKEGGNIKKMADDILSEVLLIQKQIPADIEFKVLVNPSDFIKKSITGVIREVLIAAFIAVVILFLFIGSFKNVATAAIEIPLSLIMAFILMRMTGMNLNLISLGGLALSAGMNVDASVVVLENIFRHFEDVKKDLDVEAKLQIILKAVNEVKVPVIASTLASLVVFTPLIFTQGLTNSLLGDLAKAVIFSHGLSAIVALVLVPTIRLQLLSRGKIDHSVSPIEKYLLKLENGYGALLRRYLQSPRFQKFSFIFILVLIPVLILTLVPRLKKEVIGRPETDWLIVGIYSPAITTARQMESEIVKLEEDLFKNFGPDMQYTFTQIDGAQNGYVMMRLVSREKVEELSAKAETIYKNTPTLYYFVEKWNPSELQIPEPPEMELQVIGGDPQQRLQVAEDLLTQFSDQGVYDQVSTTPSARRDQFISVDPMKYFTSQSTVISKGDLSHYLRTATKGVFVEDFNNGVKTLPIYLRFPEERVTNLAQIQALPIGFEGRLIPLGALAQFQVKPKELETYRQNQTSMMNIVGELKKVNKNQAPEHQAKALKIIEKEKEKLSHMPKGSQPPTLNLTVPDFELQRSLDQLKNAVLISALLVFLIMVIQLGDIVQASLVMVAVPLGFIGVILSLFIFRSSLSLNSGLGTILLNGIAVANSIILVDFISKLFKEGKSAFEATLQASVIRFRPILMTSLTTVVGMLPIALGHGEGGQILQPLGIAVSGGLWVSTIMTLFLVPALQQQYLHYLEKKRKPSADFFETLQKLESVPQKNNPRPAGPSLDL